MEKIINNEGKTVEVETGLYNELEKIFQSGVWATLIKVNDQPHMVILEQNFSY